MKCQYTSGLVIDQAVAVIWEDRANEESGYFRAFWSDSPDGTTGSTVIGYCSPGGSHKTIKEVVAEFKSLYPNEPIYRNGRKVA